MITGCRGSRALLRTATAMLVSAAVIAGPGIAAAAGVPAAAAIPGAQTPPPPDLTPSPAPPTHQPHEQLTRLGAADAWQFSTGADVVVAVLDSGVDAEHPDLAGRVLPGLDLVDGSTDGREDPVGHGTTVASLVAGAGEPALGLAPDATVLPVRVLDEDNRYQEATTIADGVVWAVDEGADVINLSLGGPRESSALALALAYAMTNDVVVVACTGNLSGDETYEVWYPAREPGVLAVAGVDFIGEGAIAAGWRASLTGPETVLAAPAVVTGADVGGGHRRVQGTSFASALVAGAAALLRSAYPEMPAAEVVHRLVTTADDLGQPGRSPDYGYGLIDPVAALTAPSFEVLVNPLDTKARHGVAGFGTAPAEPWQLAGDPSPVPDAGPTAGAAPPAGGRTSEAPAWVLLSTVAFVATALGLAAAAAAQRSSAPGRPSGRS